MRTLFFWGLDGIAAAVLLLPVFWLLNRYCLHSGKKAVWYFLFSLYLCAVYVVVGLPDIRYIRLDFNINLKPFAYMFSDYRSTSLNILLFMPLGFFLTMLWEPFRKARFTILFGFCVSLLIELLQIFTYRATDINDLMTNTLGSLLGWCLGAGIRRLVPSHHPGTDTQNVYALCAISFFIMFFLHPFLADALVSALYHS